jgi:hypothetical protein
MVRDVLCRFVLLTAPRSPQGGDSLVSYVSLVSMKKVFVVLFACAATLHIEIASAQGFRSFSERNHPEITWLTATTEHFTIVYPERLAGIEGEAGAIAEESYAALSENLGVQFDRRIRIYLSDEDEITNGFAVPIGEGFTNIWVHLNDVAEGWTGPEKWLRKVIAHELAHIFHFRAVESNMGLLQNLVANPLPRFWTEGLAQYLTEDWDAQRGDRWLRTAVLDDRLSYTDGRSVWNGRLMYAIGNSQVRFFAEQFGDSLLAELHQHRRPALFGLFQVHDFPRAFRTTTGETHRAFYDRWRRHVNVYYNTLAGQMENVDSLDVPHMHVPGQYLYDIRHGEDTTRSVVLSLESIERPIMRLHAGRRVLAEGPIRLPISVSEDGSRVAYARTVRGRFGSLINDLYVTEIATGRERRLTRDRRAAAPAFHPEGHSLAFVAAERGTADVWLIDLSTNEERQLTAFTGDVQIGALAWHPSGESIAMARFDDDGRRDIALLDVETGVVRSITDGVHDDRDPTWSPDGTRIAYTSYRDHVPNVFMLDVDSDERHRVTRLATGARVRDWMPTDTTFTDGRLLIISNVTKERDRAYAIDASRRVADLDAFMPPEYAAWTEHRPPAEVPTVVEPDAGLILERGRYNSWRNITHAATLPLPYYLGDDTWGVMATTAFVEPLGKHAIAASVALNVGDIEETAFVATYVNNQLRPTLTFSAYRGPGTVARYGDDWLVERFAGGDVEVLLPVDWRHRPFTHTHIGLRLRYAAIDPRGIEPLDLHPALPMPHAERLADARLEIQRSARRPFRWNVIHPLDGYGVRLRLSGAERVLGADSRFIEADAAAYSLLPSIGRHRFYMYGRFRAREGQARPQDFIGLSRLDDLHINVPELGEVEFGTRERVRGFREYAIGDRLAFGTVEYRVPLLRDLQTRILGIVALGATSVAAFADGGIVWDGNAFSDGERRIGTGGELKNALRIGPLRISHALGVAGPMTGDVSWEDGSEVYYRVRAAVPF